MPLPGLHRGHGSKTRQQLMWSYTALVDTGPLPSARRRTSRGSARLSAATVAAPPVAVKPEPVEHAETGVCPHMNLLTVIALCSGHPLLLLKWQPSISCKTLHALQALPTCRCSDAGPGDRHVCHLAMPRPAARQRVSCCSSSSSRPSRLWRTTMPRSLRPQVCLPGILHLAGCLKRAYSCANH